MGDGRLSERLIESASMLKDALSVSFRVGTADTGDDSIEAD